MTDIFRLAARPNQDLFFKKNDDDDVRLGEVVSSKTEDYIDSEIVILGCPQDEGVRRSGGRIGAALAPDAIRTQFYKLSNFGISRKIFDIGNTIIQKALEETHEIHTQIVKQILKDGKKIIILGGGNDISYADGQAMAKICGSDNWIGINIDAHFDVRSDFPRNSGTAYRQLLEENLIKPRNFYEIAWQARVNSPVYFEYLQNFGVNLTSLEEVQSSKLTIQNVLEDKINTNNAPKNIFFGFDVDAVRASDAPGASAASPTGLTAEEFIETVKFAGENERTRIIEFTETNPNFDIDNRTTKLVAAAMHVFLSNVKTKKS